MWIIGVKIMKKTICPTCKGRKKMLGLGLIEKECYVCNGDGYTVAEEPKKVSKKKD